jgi:hypothetical protein
LRDRQRRFQAAPIAENICFSNLAVRHFFVSLRLSPRSHAGTCASFANLLLQIRQDPRGTFP